MSQNAAPSRGLQPLQPNASFAAWGVLLAAFLLRLWKASGTFLNLDEAMHCLAANKPSLAEAYRASLGLAHPPLLILFLNVWQKFGTSELFLRLPSVIAGTIFCWIFFKWLIHILGPTPAWIGFALVSFLPTFIELSAEVRQYPFLLCFMISAAYVLELAFTRNSASQMLLFFLFLYLAMLTHFSAILFAAAVGIYSVWRLISARRSRGLLAIWMAGQAGALALFAFLYQTHISILKDSPAARNMHAFLANSYFHWGRDHLVSFVFARSFGVLQYAFGQLVIGDIAGALFVAGVVLLLAAKKFPGPARSSPQQLGIFLILPFVMNCVTAIVDLYPYGGTRHSAFLLPFAIAGVSVSGAKLTRQRLAPALAVALLAIALCQGFGKPHRPFMTRQDQHKANMTQVMEIIRQQVQPTDTVLVDFQTSFLLRFYLCPEVGYGDFSAAGLRTFSCGGKRVIATNPEINIFTTNAFLRRWQEMVTNQDLKPGQRVWIFQAGWDIGLARELQKQVPEFHNLTYDSFGRNILLFKLTVGQTSRS